jgi:2-amino-4,5-dihydroxy-6-oxo-7-(phosphonooxy)heptanoate synthase
MTRSAGVMTRGAGVMTRGAGVMTPHGTFARRLRLRRLHRHGDRGLLVVPLDHAVTDGPILPDGGLDRLVGQVCAAGADAVVLHKGSLRYVDPGRFDATALVVHLSASTAHAPDPDAKYLVTGVEEALRLGADGVSVHVNLGSRSEQRQIADLATVADACDRWNLPLLAMVYPRGPQVADPRDPELVAHAVTIAAELGADLVKTVFPGSPEAMSRVVRGCPIPVLVAGGPAGGGTDALLDRVRAAMRGGAAGAAVGRHIFQAADPGAVTRKVAEMIHHRYEPSGARA